ncbi:MAG: hypothetical protein AAB927_00155 [Patescibacteria group bacterium]
MNALQLDAIAARFSALLEKHYEPGFGISPAAEPHENFYRQVWTRDFAHAAAHYFIGDNPQAVEDSLSTLLRHQRPDGTLPIRVEREYLVLKLIPGLRFLARPMFVLFEEILRGRAQRPAYTGQDFLHSEDTIPGTLIVAGMYHGASERGRVFIESYTKTLRRALEHFSSKAKPNGLVSVPRGNVDWADSILRGGTLGLINILWVRALELMVPVFAGIPDMDTAQRLYERAKPSLLETLYDREGAYFRASADEDRVDTVATIFGARFFLDAVECVRTQQMFRTRLRCPSGIRNFDPPYPPRDILWPHKIVGHQGYHNVYVWPWVTLQNIHVKIKIAQTHPEETVREQYKKEAVDDLYDAAALFTDAGGAYEIFFPDTRTPANTRWYHPPRNFMASMATFMSAYSKLKSLGWLAA